MITIEKNPDDFQKEYKKKKYLLLGDSFNNASLTYRESDVLKYLILGYTAKKTAIQLGISYRTVETYVETLKLKLQCSSKRELIEKTIRSGLIKLLNI